ncbi:hypothetical protein FRB94_005884 [Tulasnella sp. JGI-2019a]|nr:hypothetical protein FRB94_005884 [Tulasnella sp. JGI-2019a]
MGNTVKTSYLHGSVPLQRFDFLTHLSSVVSFASKGHSSATRKDMSASMTSSSIDVPIPSHLKGISGLVANASQVGATIGNATPACEGWLLKKRRKKMQGYAKRYFTLSSLGLLSYATHPGGPIRDQITLRLASISSLADQNARSIHIDSGTATFHLKALGPNDYALWMAAFRRFCTFPVASANGDDPLLTPQMRRASLSTPRAMTGSIYGGTSATRAFHAAHDLGITIREIEDALHDLAASPEVEKIDKKANSSKAKKEKDKDSHHSKDKEKEKEKEHHHKFVLFHRKGSNSQHGLNAANNTPPVTPSPSTHETSFDSYHPPSPLANHSPSSRPTTSSSSIDLIAKLHTSVATLRVQHNALINLLDTPNLYPPSAPASMKSPLLRVNELIALSQSQSHHSPRPSIGTIDSVNSPSLWYDAEEGAEEFVLTNEPGAMTRFNSSATIFEDDVGETATEDDDDDGSADEVSGMVVTSNTSTPKEPLANSVRFQLDAPLEPKVIVRRTCLPAPTSGDDGSLLSVLRKNVGKDLSTVSFPVSFNEPISILQRLAEDVEYTNLLDQAVATADPVERICLIAAFAVSGYACTLYRASRKPFNPMLGETFEDIRMNFIAEKVCHHPAIMACHASGQGWEYWATSSADSKFWGRSLEIINKGTTHVKIGQSHYKWQKPSSFMRNLIVGEKYLTHEGEMTITDTNTGHRCVVTFKEGGYFGGSRSVQAVVSHPRAPKQVLARLDGSWNDGVSLLLDAKGSHLKVLWRANPFPAHAQQYYGFTDFTMSLNEITDDLKDGRLPPTDSRFRPDQRAMEEGEIEIADSEKERIEVAQRARRKARDENGEVWTPRWFEPSEEEDEWVFKGDYWESREKKSWDVCPTLW